MGMFARISDRLTAVSEQSQQPEQREQSEQWEQSEQSEQREQPEQSEQFQHAWFPLSSAHFVFAFANRCETPFVVASERLRNAL